MLVFYYFIAINASVFYYFFQFFVFFSEHSRVRVLSCELRQDYTAFYTFL